MNHLYFGDNLRVLRDSIADASVDLIYLDPPFNSNASYNVLFKGPEGAGSQAQIEAFDDTWHWTEAAEEAYSDVLKSGNTDAAEMLRAMRGFLGDNDMMAYLAMMAVRLIELHRVLKPTGSLYLHCDPTASHYLKIWLDAVFGAANFGNEIIWKRKAGRGETNRQAVRFGVSHDVILSFRKSERSLFNRQYRENNPEYIKSKFVHKDENGRVYRLDNLTSPSPRPNLRYEYKGYPPPANGCAVSPEKMAAMDAEGRIHFPADKTKRLQRRRFLDELEGETVDTLWDDVPPINSQARERLGYPTQKPVALLERIVAASSNPGDVVLDPFCGCGTTVHAAEKLGRQWIGVDVTHLAIGLIQRRLRDAFGDKLAPLHRPRRPARRGGRPRAGRAGQAPVRTLGHLADPQRATVEGGKKGADQGVDGVLYVEGPNRRTEMCVIEVKGGSIGDAQIRSLIGAMERQKAPMGVFVTLNPPTKPMISTAAAAGTWETDWGAVPRVQIVTIEQLLTTPGSPLRIPMARTDTFRKAARETRTDQGKLDI